MKTLLTVLCILLLTTVALAEKPVIQGDHFAPARIACPFEVTSITWDFNDGDWGFTPEVCDATGGAPVWAYGQDTNFPGLNLWATVLNGNYLPSSGEALVSPTFMVDTSTNLVQIVHYFDTELTYDGMNLMVNGTVVEPMEGYNLAVINPSTSYYAFCVDGQPGFSGHDLADYVMITSCFDLAAFEGQDVALALQFGSDSSVQYPGWYIGSVVVGGTQPVSTETTTWDSLKAQYK